MTLEVDELSSKQYQSLKNIENPIKKQEESKSIFEKIDDAIGLTALKEVVKEYSGLNWLSDKITEAVDDGDDNKLSLGERLWEGVKGAGKAVEGFIGSQGLAFMGALWAGGALASAAGVGKLFNIATKAYFLYEGSKLAVTGTKDFVEADTKEEAKTAATTATTGGIILYGTVKGLKKDYQNYKTGKATQAQFETQVKNSKMVLDIPENEPLTETSLKKAYRNAAKRCHTDKGGSTNAFVEVQEAYEFLSKNLEKAPKAAAAAAAKAEQAQPQTTNQNEQALMLREHNTVAETMQNTTTPTVKPTLTQTAAEVPTTAEGMLEAIKEAPDYDALRTLNKNMKGMPQEVKTEYFKRSVELRQQLSPEQKDIAASSSSIILRRFHKSLRSSGSSPSGSSRHTDLTRDVDTRFDRLSWARPEESTSELYSDYVEADAKLREVQAQHWQNPRAYSDDLKQAQELRDRAMSRYEESAGISRSSSSSSSYNTLMSTWKTVIKDGFEETYIDDVLVVKSKVLIDGTKQFYDTQTGLVEKDIFPDGTYKKYASDGKRVIEESFTEGTVYKYNKAGVTLEARFPDGSKKYYFDNGKLKKHITSDGGYKIYNENGIMTEECYTITPEKIEVHSYETHYDGRKTPKESTLTTATRIIKKYNDNGNLLETIETTPEVTYRRHFYSEGIRSSEIKTPSKNIITKYNENGVVLEETLPDGSAKYRYDNGNMKKETFADRAYKLYNENGVMIEESYNITPEKVEVHSVYKTIDGCEIPEYSTLTTASSITKTYDDNGNLLETVETTPKVIYRRHNIFDDGSVSESETKKPSKTITKKYNEKGKVVEIVEKDSNGNVIEPNGNVIEPSFFTKIKRVFGIY